MESHLRRGPAWLVLMGLVACSPLVGLDEYVVERDVARDGGADGGGAIVVSPTDIVFSEARCKEAKTTALTVTNPGAAKISVEASIAASDTFTIDGATGGALRFDLQPNETRAIKLAALGALPGTKTANLVISTGAEPIVVPLRLATHGALLKVAPEVVDFGQVRRDTTPAPLPVVFHNDGDVAVSVKSVLGASTDFVLPSDVLVPPGGDGDAVIGMKPGPAGDPIVVAATIDPSVALCGANPTLTLKGHRVNQDVTVNPATIDLGAPACNTTPTTTAKVTISNYSTVDAVSFGLTLPASSRFTVATATGTVPKASGATPGTTEVAVGLKATGPTIGTFEESLEVKLLAPAAVAGTKTLKLGVTVTGVALELSQTLLTFSGSASAAVQTVNRGNVKACFSYVRSGDSRLQPEPDDEVAPGLGEELTLLWSGSAGANGDATVTMVPKVCTGTTGPALVFCAPAPVLQVQHR